MDQREEEARLLWCGVTVDQMEEEVRLLWCGPDGGGGEAAAVVWTRWKRR